MAYSPRPDGMFDVTLDSGQVVPMALSEQQLQAAGHTLALPGGPAPVGPDMRVAGPGGAPEAFQNPYSPAPPAFQNPYTNAPAPGPAAPPAVDPAAPAPKTGFGGIPRNRGEGIGNPIDYIKTHTLTGKKVEAKPTFGTSGSAPVYKDVPHEATDVNVAGGEKTRTDTSNLVSASQPAAPAPEAPAKKTSGGGGGGGAKPYRLPDDIRNDLTGDTRPEDAQDAAHVVAGLRMQQQYDREQHLLDQRSELDKQHAERALIDKKIRDKEELIDKRDREAEGLKPQTAKEVWHDRGTFAQLMSSVSVILGGYLQGAQRRNSNPGLDMLNDSIREEIANQRARYEDALADGKQARNDYQKALELYGTPEAAEQDMRMRRLAIADGLINNRAQQIGTTEYLAAGNAASQALKQQRGQAKLQLADYERARTLQAAAAASARAQAQQLAQQGIVKIGNTMYTVDPSTKQYIPLDKAAAQALKAQGDAAEAGGIPGRGLGLEVRAQTAQAALDALAEHTGMARDAKGKWFVSNPKLYAESLVPGTQAWNDAQAARGQLAGEHAVIVNGGNQPSVDEKEEYHKKWHSMRPGAVEANMNNLQDNIDVTRSTLRNVRVRKVGEAGGGPTEAGEQ